MRFVSIQTNFSTGEMDPLLRSRIDLDAYGNALETATNVLIQPQGGARRRPGLHYISALPASGAESAANGVRLVPFEFSVDDSYMFCFTHNRMYIFKNEALVTNINGSGNSYLDTSAVGLTGARLADICWTQSADTMIVAQEGINPVEIARGGTDATWTITALAFESIPKYAFALTTSNPGGSITPSAVSGTVTITWPSGSFTSAHVGQYINAQPQGRAKITQFESSGSVKAVTEYPFFNIVAITNGNWELETGYEAVWSATRGWPKTVTFHEGRLYFGGSSARPSTIWGSKVGLFFDFEASTVLDDDAVEATLDTNTYNEIVDIVSGRDLQIFTSGGEFFVPQEGLNPITPANFFVKTVTNNGCKPGTRAQQLDSGTLFIQRQGKSINEFAFTDTQLTYVTAKISLLAGHLLKNPGSLALRRAVATDENDLLLIANADDGSVAVFSMLRAQNVIAPSKFVTDGLFKSVGVDVTTIYAVVKRTINGSDVYYVEYMDDDSFTDSCVQGTTGSSASVAHLEGKVVNVLQDGAVMANATVASGTVTFSRASTTSYEVGLPYTVTIKTMPADLKIQTGTRVGFKKRIVEVNAIVHESQHMIVNGVPVQFRAFNAPTLNTPVPSYTGTKTVQGMRGYTQDGQITVTQNLPLRLTLLGMEYKLSTHQGT